MFYGENKFKSFRPSKIKELVSTFFLNWHAFFKVTRNRNIAIGVGGAVLTFSIGLIWYNSMRSASSTISPIGNELPADMRTIPNPLTGLLYTEDEAASWINIRPIAVVVNNAVPARPQSGIIYADMVYEIVAEGGITRFIAFYLTEEPEKVGPIRSARHYYLPWVKELGDAMFAHIGWSPQALQFIEVNGVRSLNRGGAQFWRDQDRLNRGISSEHTAYMDLVYLRKLGNDLGWVGTSDDFLLWNFKEDAPTAEPLEEIILDFWSRGSYSAIFQYKPETNTYLRFMGFDSSDAPLPHLDNETQEQVEVKNLIVQFATESRIPNDDANRLDYQVIGSGDALVFIDGDVIEATWAKRDIVSRTLFYDKNGNEIQFNRGKFWVSVLPDRNVDQVYYE